MADDKEDDKPDDSGDGDHGDDSGAGDETPVLERLAAMEARFEELLGGGDDDDGAGEQQVTAPTRTDDRESIRAQVHAALTEAADSKALKEKVDKIEQIVERPPLKQSKLSRAFWGRVEA